MVATVAGPASLGLRAQRPLAPTEHPTLPRSETDLWLVPSASDRSARISTTSPHTLATGVRRYRDGDYAAALTTLTRVPPSPALDDYVDYYSGLARLRLSQLPEAQRTFSAIVDRKPEGAVASMAALALGETAEAAGDYKRAVEIYQRLAGVKAQVTDEVLSRLGRAALKAEDRKT